MAMNPKNWLNLPTLIRMLFLLSCLTFLAAGTGDSSSDPELRKVTFGENTWFVLDNNLPDVLRLAQKEDKLVFLVYFNKDNPPYNGLNQTLGNPGLEPLLERVIPLYTDTTFNEAPKYSHLLWNCSDAYLLIIFVDPKGNMCSGALRISNTEELMGRFDDAELIYETENELEKNPRNSQFGRLYLNLLGNMELGWNDLILEKLDFLIELDPDPDSWTTQYAYEWKIKLYVYNASILAYLELAQEYLLSIEKDYLHVFELYYPDKFRYSLRGYDGFGELMDFYGWIDRPEKAIEVFDTMRSVDLPLSYANKWRTSRLDLYQYALYLLGDLEKEYERAWLYFNELLDIGKRELKPTDRLHYVYRYCNYMEAFIQYWSRHDPDMAHKWVVKWNAETRDMIKTYDLDIDFKSFFVDMLLKLALHDKSLVEEALLESCDFMKFNACFTFNSLVVGRAKLLARERSKEVARDLLIATMSDERLFTVTRFYSQDLFEQAVLTLLELNITDDIALSFVEKMIDFLPDNRKLKLLAQFYAARQEYDKAISVIDRSLDKLNKEKQSNYRTETRKKELLELRSEYSDKQD